MGLTELPNIGKTLEARLKTAGIHTVEDLAEAGPAEVYRRMSLLQPDLHLPVCYNLYSLEGALTGAHWNAVPEERKRRLLEEIETFSREGWVAT